ncbi:cAMP-binding domain of CRP or a regulatory subunit of cAMP-dependent protein kinases [Chitinophaga sp. CF118]|uniref:Crp/Fnr family transcriptional regulator n=1 Tax=Chitinophaga sp. CF118 TaxID=1884367 RepID=UPI0008EB5351|nr:Crp/Fnr family transcriptional regulator [Chitinophaga sp. CF118]SFD15771.1 cAMP-binding domain of CRP or a regulatory subunit of cAMP-dependent protein kinases [Chitinophaga sp. CF118]
MNDYYDKILNAISCVSPITETDWALCKPGLQYKEIKKGENWVEEGKTYKEIAFVLKGVFRAFQVIDGEQINCNFYFEGQWPKAYHSFLTQKPSKMWIQAMEDSNVFLISYDHLQYLFNESKNWERFGRIATENAFIAAQERNDMLLLDTPETRYINLGIQYPLILDRIPLYHIASYIGVKQPSLSRIRRRIAKKDF